MILGLSGLYKSDRVATSRSWCNNILGRVIEVGLSDTAACLSALGSARLDRFPSRKIVENNTYAQRQKQDADWNDNANSKLF